MLLPLSLSDPPPPSLHLALTRSPSHISLAPSLSLSVCSSACSTSDDQLGGLTTPRHRLTNRPKIFGPSVTTTDEDDDEFDGVYDSYCCYSALLQPSFRVGGSLSDRGDVSEALAILDDAVDRPDTAHSQITDTQSISDDTSTDLDLPDESTFLEKSVRLTRDAMQSPLSDKTEKASDTETEELYSRDEIVTEPSGMRLRPSSLSHYGCTMTYMTLHVSDMYYVWLEMVTCQWSMVKGVGDSSVVESAPRDTQVLRGSTESSCWALVPQVCSDLPRNREQW